MNPPYAQRWRGEGGLALAATTAPAATTRDARDADGEGLNERARRVRVWLASPAEAAAVKRVAEALWGVGHVHAGAAREEETHWPTGVSS